MYGVFDAKRFLNAKVKVTVTLNDRDDTDDFSKSLSQKTITITNKGFNKVWLICLKLSFRRIPKKLNIY